MKRMIGTMGSISLGWSLRRILLEWVQKPGIKAREGVEVTVVGKGGRDGDEVCHPDDMWHPRLGGTSVLLAVASILGLSPHLFGGFKRREESGPPITVPGTTVALTNVCVSWGGGSRVSPKRVSNDDSSGG